MSDDRNRNKLWNGGRVLEIPGYCAFDVAIAVDVGEGINKCSIPTHTRFVIRSQVLAQLDVRFH